MEFNRPTVFIDPSYTCSGVCFVNPKSKTIRFDGFASADTKRDLQKYYLAAKDISRNLVQYLGQKCTQEGELDVVMEAPFPGSFASSGLFMLQGLILIQTASLIETGQHLTLYSLPPSYISSQIKKVCNKKDGIGVRKQWTSEKLQELKALGWRFEHESILKEAGADPHTAFGFWYFLRSSNKELPRFLL